MTERLTLARRRLAQAKETLLEAETLIDKNYCRGAVNRLYYAAFYAVRAVLAIRGLESTRHSGTIALFQQHFVKTGAIPVETGRFLQRVFDERQTSDYADLSEPARPHVLELRQGVQVLVDTCEEWIAAQERQD